MDEIDKILNDLGRGRFYCESVEGNYVYFIRDTHYQGWVHQKEDLRDIQHVFNRVMEWYKQNGIEIKEPKLYVLYDNDFEFMRYIEDKIGVDVKFSTSPMFVIYENKGEDNLHYLSKFLEDFPYDKERLMTYVENTVNKNAAYYDLLIKYFNKFLPNGNIYNIVFIHPDLVLHYFDRYIDNKVIESYFAHELWHIYEAQNNLMGKPSPLVSEGSATYVQEIYAKEVLNSDRLVDNLMIPLYVIAKNVFNSLIPESLSLEEKKDLLFNENIRNEAFKKAMNELIRIAQSYMQK